MTAIIRYRSFGGPDVLELGDETVPAPAVGEVTIENRAIGVNPVDWKIVAGYLPHYVPETFPGVPGVPGNESAGVVVALGEGVGLGVREGVDELAIGDAVIWRGLGGTYRERRTVPATKVARIPEGVPFEQAAAAAIAGGTALAIVRQAGVGPRDVVLVHGAAGGVGSAAVQLARATGARVIGTASPANHDYLRSLGAAPVAYGEGLVEAVRALGGVTAVVDAVAGADSTAATVALLPDLTRAATALWDDHAQAAGIPDLVRRGTELADVLGYLARGELRFEVQTLPLADAGRAFELSRAGHVRGKLVLVP